MSPAQGVGDTLWRGVGEDREHERFHVPKGVAVVAGAGEPFRGDRPLLGARGGLEDVEHRKANGLLHGVVAFELDVRARPEGGEVAALGGSQSFPPVLNRGGERTFHLRSQRRHRPQARPAVSDELDQRQALAGLDL